MAKPNAPRTARERARAELTREIKEEARRQLAAVGADALSLRAVARELGMVSSALYRYYPSRDDLLTALIIDAYNAVGAAAETAIANARPAAGREPGAGIARARWLAACHAIRAWAIADPHEYALIYGSPVPGYRAPEATIGPAARVPLAFVGVLAAAAACGELDMDGCVSPEFPLVGILADQAAILSAALVQASAPAPAATPAPASASIRTTASAPGSVPVPVAGPASVAGPALAAAPVPAGASVLAAAPTSAVPPDALVRGVIAWTQLFGMISFELFGQFVGSFEPADALFAHAAAQLATFVGLR